MDPGGVAQAFISRPLGLAQGRMGLIIAWLLVVATSSCASRGATLRGNWLESIEGTATPGATVTIANPGRGLLLEVRANRKGHYRSRWLPAGTYIVTTEGVSRQVTLSGRPSGRLSDVVD
jgi:hypothetical protein